MWEWYSLDGMVFIVPCDNGPMRRYEINCSQNGFTLLADGIVQGEFDTIESAKQYAEQSESIIPSNDVTAYVACGIIVL